MVHVALRQGVKTHSEANVRSRGTYVVASTGWFWAGERPMDVPFSGERYTGDSGDPSAAFSKS
jgi:hypothetical protein